MATNTTLTLNPNIPNPVGNLQKQVVNYQTIDSNNQKMRGNEVINRDNELKVAEHKLKILQQIASGVKTIEDLPRAIKFTSSFDPEIGQMLNDAFEQDPQGTFAMTQNYAKQDYTQLLNQYKIQKQQIEIDNELNKYKPRDLAGNIVSPNNNVGNLKDASGQFRSFATPEEGMQAMNEDLIAKVTGNSPAMRQNLMGSRDAQGPYQATPENLISTYAPPSENNTEQYIKNVSEWTGLKPNEVLDANDVSKLQPAMMRQEGGISNMPDGLYQNAQGKPYEIRGGKLVSGARQNPVPSSIQIAEMLSDPNVPQEKKDNLRLAIRQTAKEAGDIAAAKEGGKLNAQDRRDLPKILSNGKMAIDTIDAALSSDGFDKNFGIASYVYNRRGSDAADAKAYIDQIAGQNFLTVYETLKGGGQITEVEGTKGEAAKARLINAQSPEAARKALNELKGIIQKGMDIAEAQALGKPIEEMIDMAKKPSSEFVPNQTQANTSNTDDGLIDFNEW